MDKNDLMDQQFFVESCDGQANPVKISGCYMFGFLEILVERFAKATHLILHRI